MESSVDNDHFLLSLESAVFTTAPTCGGVTKAVAPLYSPTFHDGDLGDACSVEGGLGGSKDGLLYPPLPPGSPVVGFAELHESVPTIATDLGRAATPPLEEEEEEEEIRLRAKSTTFNHCSCNEHQLNSPDSESSATAMLSSTHGLRQSVSVSDLENRPPSTNLETWMSNSDEHLLISPTGGKASSLSSSVKSQAKEANMKRSYSSEALSREWVGKLNRELRRVHSSVEARPMSLT
ncbi:unnamed protein product [Taenia asiatica]|uniref:Rho GTPase-activating protein 20 n=1 Tax=Taenia asiatica TaxID=60517 RepID=A0A0R3W971_TAEAS|nr:unnamed protein product [Taenia asiatica]